MQVCFELFEKSSRVLKYSKLKTFSKIFVIEREIEITMLIKIPPLQSALQF